MRGCCLYAPVGKVRDAFKLKKNNNKKEGQRGKDEPDTLDPSVYPTLVFLLDVDPVTIISRVTHEFCRTIGFYFCKKTTAMCGDNYPICYLLSLHFQ